MSANPISHTCEDFDVGKAMRMMQKRDAKETILRYAAEDLLNFRFFTRNYGFIYARLKVLSTKRGYFVDKVNAIADSGTKSGQIVPKRLSGRKRSEK